VGVTWAYGLVEDGAAAPAVAGPPGCGPTRVVPVAPGVALLAAEAPVPEYAADAIERRLGDLDWVSAVALGHERVLEAAGRASAVVPLKLFTLFTSDDRAVEELAAGAVGLRAALRRLADRDEWGLRIRLAPAPVASTPVEKPASGRAFLEARRDRKNARQARSTGAAEIALSAHRELLALAADGMVRPPAAVTSPPLLDAVYLVDRSRLARFQAAAEELAARLGQAGCTVELTGPWPGYSFAGEAA
jgi:hypothetical protein